MGDLVFSLMTPIRSPLGGRNDFGANFAVGVKQGCDGGEMGGHIGNHTGDTAGRQHSHVGDHAVLGAFVNHHIVAFAMDGVVHHVGAGVVVQFGAGSFVGVCICDDAFRSGDRVAADEVVGFSLL